MRFAGGDYSLAIVVFWEYCLRDFRSRFQIDRELSRTSILLLNVYVSRVTRFCLREG